MGVNLRDLIVAHEIEWSELKGKTIAIDALNVLYQFLSIIRQPDGTPLMDANGNITSHLTGLFYRTVRVMEQGIKPVYVFDGKPHDLKGKELERRKEAKKIALEEYEAAKERGDLEAMKKHAMRTSRFTPEMLQDSKDLLEAMGIPWIQAPHEGEVQCAHMAKTGAVYATGSQDYDTLLAGSPRLIKNMTMQERFQLERIDLEENLKKLGLTQEQLVEIAILVGTDYNLGGVKGIGPKKALKAVKEGRFKEFEEQIEFSDDVDVDMLKGLFLKPEVKEKVDVKFTKASKEKVDKVLVDGHGFSEERVGKALKRLGDAYDKTVSQSNLSQWS